MTAKKIKIKRSLTADSRTAIGEVSKEQLLESSKQHIEDVQKAMDYFICEIFATEVLHDYTKIDYIDQFHEDFCMWQREGFEKVSEWYDMHIKTERHHLNEHCPDDVTLIDVLERIADIVMAGLGRSGTVYDDMLSAEILQKAYMNTIELLKQNVEVEE